MEIEGEMPSWISSSCLDNCCVAHVNYMKQSSFPARLYAHKTVMVAIILIKNFVTGIVPVPTRAALLSPAVVLTVDLTVLIMPLGTPWQSFWLLIMWVDISFVVPCINSTKDRL